MQSKSWSRLSRKTWQKKWKQKKCGSYEEGEKNLSLQSPCFGLPTFCWLLVVRKWERARFSPPENNTNPSKLKSNTQSTSQETILKRKTSQWELHLNAAGMRCLARPLRLPLSPLPLSQGFNHNLTRTTPPLRRQDSLSLTPCPFPPLFLPFLFSLLFIFASLSLSQSAINNSNFVINNIN